MHLRKHGKEIKEESIGTITARMNKMSSKKKIINYLLKEKK
jgi:hypothetical protein